MKIANIENYVEVNMGVIEDAMSWAEKNGGPIGWEFSDNKLSEYMSANSGHSIKTERYPSAVEKVLLSYEGVKIPLRFKVGFLGVYVPHYCIFPEGHESHGLIKYMGLFKALGDLAKYKWEHPRARNRGVKKSLKERVEYELSELMFFYKNYGVGEEIFSYEWGENPQEVFILKGGKPFIKVNLKDFMKGYALEDILRMKDVMKNISFFYPKK